MRTRKIPREARHLRTYEEFRSYLDDFVRSTYPFLWIVGRPGVAKSESITSATRKQPVYYRKGGQLAPLQFYLDLHEHRGQPIILDDAEHFLATPLGTKLICAIGDTTRIKQVSWSSTTRALGEVPQVFNTTSPLCIIANRTTAHEAIQSRAVTLYFDPTNIEVHRAVAAWYWDQEIHDWFGKNLFSLHLIDARLYLHAYNDKLANRDWRQIILRAHAIDRPSSVVQDLERDASCPAREDKARRFVELMGVAKGASRATYFRLHKRLEQEGRLLVEVVPPIPLRRTRPPGVPTDLELDALAAPAPAPPEEPAGPLDVPAREAFAQPVIGNTTQPPPVPVVDDRLPWEDRPTPPDDEGEE